MLPYWGFNVPCRLIGWFPASLGPSESGVQVAAGVRDCGNNDCKKVIVVEDWDWNKFILFPGDGDRVSRLTRLREREEAEQD